MERRLWACSAHCGITFCNQGSLVWCCGRVFIQREKYCSRQQYSIFFPDNNNIPATPWTQANFRTRKYCLMRVIVFLWREENVAIFRRYIAEILCIEGFRHDISWRNIWNALQCCYSAPPFACCREDLNPKPKGLGFTRLPPGISCPLIYNIQYFYIYLNLLYKENIRIF